MHKVGACVLCPLVLNLYQESQSHVPRTRPSGPENDVLVRGLGQRSAR